MMHVPVLLHEFLEMTQPKPGELYVDCTFGAGGYSKAISACGASVLAIDQDPVAAECFSQLRLPNARFAIGNFRHLRAILNRYDISAVDCVVFDLGVSSMQLDQSHRGFSFMREGPLDMRMSGEGESARDFVNCAEEEQLRKVIFSYGEESNAKAIARAITQARTTARIDTTTQLAEIVRGAFKRPRSKIDLATKTFQAIRIHINDELGALSSGLEQALDALRSCGKLATVTFHSLEDAIVKQFIKARLGVAKAGSRYLPETTPEFDKTLIDLTRKPISPTQGEIEKNVRSRSAKLRVAQKI